MAYLQQFRTPLIGNIIIILIQVSLTVVALKTIQPVVPLLNNQQLANNTLLPKAWLTVIPTLSLFFSLCSLSLMVFCHSLNKTVLHLFAWTSTAFNGILLLALTRIIMLVR
ncbi:MAG: hypothetical protein GW946_01730 [Candidatus Pacebacteria bacterium]|nr:hypothetical protein [Candidatus Paceibacterota bacterium]PIR60470.1 MAG: hypothetical protein COU67_01705 [Candidatus Pacebacteria bacterium CG10_big_fil_rev_8_21_14_0_10_44_54]